MEDSYCIFTFNSTHHAIGAEKHLKEKNLKIRMIPLPAQISAGCGLAVRLELEALGSAQEILKLKGIIPDEIYQVKSCQTGRIFIRLTDPNHQY